MAESGLRHTMYVIIFEAETACGQAFDILLLLFILASVALTMLETVHSYHMLHAWRFWVAERVFTGVFAAEYVLRTAVMKPNPRAYVCSFFGAVDLCAILPTLLEEVTDEFSGSSMRIVRVLRLLRVFRVLHFTGLSEEAESLARAFWLARRKVRCHHRHRCPVRPPPLHCHHPRPFHARRANSPYLHHRHCPSLPAGACLRPHDRDHRRGDGVWRSLPTRCTHTLHPHVVRSSVARCVRRVQGTLMYVIEDNVHSGFTSIPRSIYWAIVTVTTVGYGDSEPHRRAPTAPPRRNRVADARAVFCDSLGVRHRRTAPCPVAPLTPLGQMVASMMMVLGYSLLAVPTGIAAAEYATSASRQPPRLQKASSWSSGVGGTARSKRGAAVVPTRACEGCQAVGHDLDAAFCKHCGELLS
jgi:hypothetical protein